MEIWKDIKGYEGYQVSNEGRIRTHNKTTYTEKHGVRHWQNRILSQKTAKDKAMRVELWKDGKPNTVLVHRIVALTFLGEPPESNMTVNHKDGNRKNNNIDNLEWLSLADNIRHGFKTGLYSSVFRPITLVDERENEFKFVSLSEGSRFLGRTNSYLGMAIKKKYQITDVNGVRYRIKE